MADREKLIKDIEKQMSESTNDYAVLWFSEAEYVLNLLKEQRQWIPAKDKTPTPGEGFGTCYIVCDEYGDVYPLRYVAKNVRGKRVVRWEWDYGNIYNGEVVAWMPLPKPYTAENNAVITQGVEANG